MSLENSYVNYSLNNSTPPTGFTIRNAYNAFFTNPSNGTHNIAMYADNFMCGYKGVAPPTDGGCIKGNVAIGQNTAACELDVVGTIRGSGNGTVSEVLDSAGALSTSKDSLVKNYASSAMAMTLADSSVTDQIKNVRLLNRSCSASVTTSRGAFNLNVHDSGRKLRYTADGWVTEDAYGTGSVESFYATTKRTTVTSASISATSAGFGMSCGISADGLTAVVGGSLSDSNVGAAWVLVRLAGSDSWTLQQKLTGTGNTGASQQGNSVAISADGNTVAVGGQADASSAGAVWVFKRTGTTWTQVGSKLVGTGATGAAEQGTSVALSADGTYLASGGHANNTHIGAVWMFAYGGSTYAQVGSALIGTGNTGASAQGTSVALSSDGLTLAVGGTNDDTKVGATWVFTSAAGASYAQQGSLIVGTGNATTSRQGKSVALSADGNTLAVGGHTDNSSAGAVWVFTRTGTTWTQQGAKLVGTGATGAAQQGSGVALSDDGHSLAVFSSADNSSVGAVWRFVRRNNTWTQVGSKLAIGVAMNAGAISMNSDGRSLIASAYTFSDSYSGGFYYYS